MKLIKAGRDIKKIMISKDRLADLKVRTSDVFDNVGEVVDALFKTGSAGVALMHEGIQKDGISSVFLDDANYLTHVLTQSNIISRAVISKMVNDKFVPLHPDIISYLVGDVNNCKLFVYEYDYNPQFGSEDKEANYSNGMYNYKIFSIRNELNERLMNALQNGNYSKTLNNLLPFSKGGYVYLLELFGVINAINLELSHLALRVFNEKVVNNNNCLPATDNINDLNKQIINDYLRNNDTHKDRMILNNEDKNNLNILISLPNLNVFDYETFGRFAYEVVSKLVKLDQRFENYRLILRDLSDALGSASAEVHECLYGAPETCFHGLRLSYKDASVNIIYDALVNLADETISFWKYVLSLDICESFKDVLLKKFTSTALEGANINDDWNIENSIDQDDSDQGCSMHLEFRENFNGESLMNKIKVDEALSFDDSIDVNLSNGLYILGGQAGSGKTTLLIYLLNAMLDGTWRYSRELKIDQNITPDDILFLTCFERANRRIKQKFNFNGNSYSIKIRDIDQSLSKLLSIIENNPAKIIVIDSMNLLIAAQPGGGAGSKGIDHIQLARTLSMINDAAQNSGKIVLGTYRFEMADQKNLIAPIIEGTTCGNFMLHTPTNIEVELQFICRSELNHYYKVNITNFGTKGKQLVCHYIGG